MFAIGIEGMIFHSGNFVENDVSDVARNISSDPTEGYINMFSHGLGPLVFPNDRWEFVLQSISIDDEPYEGPIAGESSLSALADISENQNEDGVRVVVSANEGLYQRVNEFDGEFEPAKLRYIFVGDRCVGLEYDGTMIADLDNSYADIDGYSVEFSYFDPKLGNFVELSVDL